MSTSGNSFWREGEVSLSAADDNNSNAVVVGALNGDKGTKGGWRAGPDEAAARHVVTQPAYALRSDASRDGQARTPSPDAEGRVRLRDPGFSVEEEVAPTLDAVQPHTVAHTLKAEGADASEDGTGRGVPLVADTLRGAADGPSHGQATGTDRGTLTAIQDARGVVNKDQNGSGFSEGEIAYTVDAQGQQGVAYRRATRPHGPQYSEDDDERWEEADRSDSLTPHSATQNIAVSYSIYPESGEGADLRAAQIDVAPALAAEEGDQYERGTRVVSAFTERTSKAGRTLEAQEDAAYALTNPASGGRAHSHQVADGMAVRRLTPVECERLQGFPDGWTEGLSDSGRYRCLGNAVCVPVAQWVGRRIVEVEAAR